MKPLFVVCGFVIGFCGAGAIYVPMVRSAHETAQSGLDTAKEWKRLFCATTEGRISMVCQQDQPPIVKPTVERRDRNPRVML